MLVLTLIGRNHQLRSRVETIISEAFAEEHNAQLKVFPPTLVAWLKNDAVVTAAALRFPSDGFFSECYLDAPVESLIGSHADGRPPARDQIVEFGHLAAARPGALLALSKAIIQHCYAMGYRWAFFTATARLRAMLRCAGIDQIDLAAATSDRVAAPKAWGRYYLSDPRVIAIGAHMLSTRLTPSQRRLDGSSGTI